TIPCTFLAASVILPFSFSRSGDLLALHSFPTRRSSDLERADRLPAPHVPQHVRDQLAVNAHVDLRELTPAVDREARPVREHAARSEEHTSELQSRENLVCRLLLEKKKTKNTKALRTSTT